MANTAMNVRGPEKLNVWKEFETSASAFLKAVDSTSKKAEFVIGKDHKTLIMVKNTHVSAAKTATLKAGNGFFGGVDVTVSIAAGSTYCIEVDSGFFKGAGGKVIVEGESADIYAGAIELI